LNSAPNSKSQITVIDRYSDEQLELLIEFTRIGREIQERHAAWLRERLRERPS